ACHQRQDQQQPGPAGEPAHLDPPAVAPFSTSFAGPANSIEVPLSVAVKPCASSVPNGPSACTGSAPAAAPRVRSSDALAVTSVVPSSRYSVTSCDRSSRLLCCMNTPCFAFTISQVPF